MGYNSGITTMGGRAGGGARGGGGLAGARASFEAARVEYKAANKALSQALHNQWQEAGFGPVSPATAKAVSAARKNQEKAKAKWNKAKGRVEKIVGHTLQWNKDQQTYV